MNHGIPRGAPVLSVILNWNGAKTLSETVSQLVAQNDINHKVLVIDNGSTDGSVDCLPQEFPEAELVRLPDNLGFARGNNAVLDWQGWSEADWQNGWLFFSNNDVYYPPDTIQKLRAVGELHPDAVAIAPWIAYAEPSDRLWFGGGIVLSSIGFIGHKLLRHNYIGEEDGSVEATDYTTACSMLLPARYFRELRGFDQGFPHYCEDVDLSLRLKKTYHGNCYVLHRTLAFHRVSSSVTGSTFKYRKRTAAQIRLFTLHFGKNYFADLGVLGYNLASAIRGKGWQGMVATWQGWRDGLRGGGNAIEWEKPK